MLKPRDLIKQIGWKKNVNTNIAVLLLLFQMLFYYFFAEVSYHNLLPHLFLFWALYRGPKSHLLVTAQTRSRDSHQTALQPSSTPTTALVRILLDLDDIISYT